MPLRAEKSLKAPRHFGIENAILLLRSRLIVITQMSLDHSTLQSYSRKKLDPAEHQRYLSIYSSIDA